jgi:LysR family transcriptional regulator, glycine cleavage system transcriptional activator
VHERRLQQSLGVAALPTFAMRGLIPRLPSFQRDHAEIEVRLITASTTAEQFQMEADIVLCGPARRSGWIGERFIHGRGAVTAAERRSHGAASAAPPADLVHYTLAFRDTARGLAAMARGGGTIGSRAEA